MRHIRFLVLAGLCIALAGAAIFFAVTRSVPPAYAGQTAIDFTSPPVGPAVPQNAYPGLGGYAVVPVRWQVAVLPSPAGTGQVTMLIDTTTGDTFVLRTDASFGYVWQRVSRH